MKSVFTPLLSASQPKTAPKRHQNRRQKRCQKQTRKTTLGGNLPLKNHGKRVSISTIFAEIEPRHVTGSGLRYTMCVIALLLRLISIHFSIDQVTNCATRCRSMACINENTNQAEQRKVAENFLWTASYSQTLCQLLVHRTHLNQVSLPHSNTIELSITQQRYMNNMSMAGVRFLDPTYSKHTSMARFNCTKQLR